MVMIDNPQTINNKKHIIINLEYILLLNLNIYISILIALKINNINKFSNNIIKKNIKLYIPWL